MKYEAKPVIVDAEEIVGVGPVLRDGGSRHLCLRNGQNVVADNGMLARMDPKPGDYWVTQADGYVYLNPKDVFERKYQPVPEIPLTGMTTIDSDGTVHGDPLLDLRGLRDAAGTY